MKLLEIAGMLDFEFDIHGSAENLLEWAVTEENRRYLCDDFLTRKTGLMTSNSEEIREVHTTVFVTENIVRKVSLERNSLIVTHHNFDYYEDERGLVPIPARYFEILRETANSIFVAHAPLDTHKLYGTSVSLAELCDIRVEELFFDYYGAPVAVIGSIVPSDFDSFAEHVRRRLRRPKVTSVKYRDRVEKLAVVAGGGDFPEILEEAYRRDCDTLLTGTVEHRWTIPSFQEGNRRFHELNRSLKLNLVGGTHYGTERPAMIKLDGLFGRYGIDSCLCEDYVLLNAG